MSCKNYFCCTISLFALSFDSHNSRLFKRYNQTFTTIVISVPSNSKIINNVKYVSLYGVHVFYHWLCVHKRVCWFLWSRLRSAGRWAILPDNGPSAPASCFDTFSPLCCADPMENYSRVPCHVSLCHNVLCCIIYYMHPFPYNQARLKTGFHLFQTWIALIDKPGGWANCLYFENVWLTVDVHISYVLCCHYGLNICSVCMETIHWTNYAS